MKYQHRQCFFKKNIKLKYTEIFFQVELLQEFAESETIALSGFQMFNLTKPSIMNVQKKKRTEQTD